MPSLKSISKGYDLIVFDGRNVSYIYYHAMARLRNKEGVPTGMYHGFLSLFLKLQIRYPNARVVVAWEGGELVRHKFLKAYKDNRPKKDDSLEEQCANLKELLSLMGAEQLFAPGYEADDVAACVAKDHKKVLLVSEDRDWNQMLRKGCAFWRKNKEVTYEKVEKAEGFPPERYALYILLKGKGSNNLKGIPYFPSMLAKEMLTVCKNLKSLRSNLSKWEQRYSKWTSVIKNDWKNLRSLYNIIKVRNDLKLEALPCRRNQNLLKKRLIRLQLFKVLTLLREEKRLRRSRK